MENRHLAELVECETHDSIISRALGALKEIKH
jgi:hypothetical protein